MFVVQFCWLLHLQKILKGKYSQCFVFGDDDLVPVIFFCKYALPKEAEFTEITVIQIQ